MSVLLTRDQWDELRVADYEEFVTAAFYLGLPYTYIQTRVRDVAYQDDRTEVIESAKELGLCPADRVLLIVKKEG
jgi:hypothetical protein